jgi:hypothetical protein
MIYEATGAFAIVFVVLILYASVWLDVRQSYRRYRLRMPSDVVVEP